MTYSHDLSGMYKNFASYLWVEDEETRAYLKTTWKGEEYIDIYVAGGHTHLQAVVRAARNDWNTHVFGFRDRDFGTSNRSRWSDPEVFILAGDAFEVENLLLDPDAIPACAVNTSGKNAAQIEQELLMLATPLTWWMSCRRTISEISEAVTADFLAHPKRGDVRSRQDAEGVIVQSRWWMSVLPALHPTWGNAGEGDPRRSHIPDLY